MTTRKRLLYIGNKLSAKGNTVTSIETLGIFLHKEGFIIHTVSSKKNKVLRLLDMLLAILRKKNIVDFVLIDTYSTQNFYFAVFSAILCDLLKLQFIPILRGGDLPNRLRTNTRLSKNIFGKSFTNLSPSKFILNEFQKAGYYNLTYIPNTIEITNYSFLPRNKVQPKLLWVRSFAEIYNPLLALEVVEILKKTGTKVSLCMVGPEKDGSLERCKKVAADLDLPIRFTGLLNKSEWINLAAEFDIFINTTNFDNMPVSVMEAMALGLPVISTNVGGIPFLIENEVNGILVPPNNAEAIVNAIENLCGDILKAKNIAINARDKIENFDWSQVKREWIKLLDS